MWHECCTPPGPPYLGFLSMNCPTSEGLDVPWQQSQSNKFFKSRKKYLRSLEPSINSCWLTPSSFWLPRRTPICCSLLMCHTSRVLNILEQYRKAGYKMAEYIKKWSLGHQYWIIIRIHLSQQALPVWSKTNVKNQDLVLHAAQMTGVKHSSQNSRAPLYNDNTDKQSGNSRCRSGTLNSI